MKKLVVFLLIVFTTAVYASPPGQKVKEALNKRSIRGSDYLVGQGYAPQTHPNATRQAREAAIADIYRTVIGNIRNVILANRDAPGHINISEYYSTVAQEPKVSVRLPGIDDIPLIPHTYNGNVYAIVAVERAALKAHYAKKASELRTKIAGNVASAQNTIDPETAAKLYLQTYVDYEALKEAEVITLGTEHQPNAKATLTELQKYIDSMGANSQEYVCEEVSDFFKQHNPPTNVGDIATIIAKQLDVQKANLSDEAVQLDLFTSNFSEAPTFFSSKLNRALTVALSSKRKVVPSASGAGSDAKLRLSGTYWASGNHMTIRAVLRDVTTGAFQAATVLAFNKKILKDISDDSYEVDEHIIAGRIADAQEELKNTTLRIREASGEILADKAQPGAPPVKETSEVSNPLPLQVRVSINKREGPQTVKIGEKLRIFVHVNQPAHIRLFSVLPEYKWTQLAKDMHITKEQTDRWVPVPGNFVVAPPVGMEQYRVIARLESNGPFGKIDQFYEADGYRYIGTPAPETEDPGIRLAHNKGLRYASKGTRNVDFTSTEQGTKGTTNVDFNTRVDSPGESSEQEAAKIAEQIADIAATDAFDVLPVLTVPAE